jgi:hypothetical protein
MTLSHCLSETASCAPFYLGLVGSRRGYVPPSPYAFTRPDECRVDASHFDWLSTAPAGLGITELEFRQALESAKRHNAAATAVPLLVLVRDAVVTANTLPNSHKHLFTDGPEGAKAAKQLVNLARHSEHVRCVRYRAPFATMRGSAAELSMADFKAKALHALWTAVCQATGYTEGEEAEEDEDETDKRPADPYALATENAAQRRLLKTESRTFVGRAATLETILDFVTKGVQQATEGETAADVKSAGPRILMVTGGDGAGKTALLAAAASKLVDTLSAAAAVVHHSFSTGDRSPLTAARRIVAQLMALFALSEDTVAVPNTADDAPDALRKAYLAASRFARVVVLIDGLEAGDDHDGLLAALASIVPSPMPAIDVRFIVATRTSSSFTTALRQRRPAPVVVPLPDLEAEERPLVLRAHLRILGRRLEESASRGGNQLLPLTKKAESGNPGYLVQTLTFLRLFATYDTLNRDIRSVGSNASAIQADILLRFERRFGADVCRPVLQSLLLSGAVDGMNEEDLQRLGPEGSVAAARQLLYALEPVVQWRGGVLKLTSAGMVTAITKRYFNNRDDRSKANAALVAFYTRPLQEPNAAAAPAASVLSLKSVKDMPLPGRTPGTSSAATAARRELPYHRLSGRSLLCLLHHAVAAKQYEVVEAMTSSVACLEAIIEAKLLPTLLATIATLATAARLVYRQLQPFVDFLVAHRHILAKFQELTLQCALNMPERSPVWQAAMRVPKEERDSRPMVLWRNRDAHGDADCTQTTVITHREILCAAFDESGKTLAVGGKDWACRCTPFTKAPCSVS